MIERLMLKMVWHLPRTMVYWAVVRAFAEASEKMPHTAVYEITAFEVLEHLRPRAEPTDVRIDLWA